MKRLLLLLALFTLMLPAPAQRQRRTTKPAAAQTQKKSNRTKQQKKQQAKPTKEQLRRQQQDMARQRKEQQRRAEELNRHIKQSLDSVLILDHQIGRQQQAIDSLSGEITTLTQQIDTLERQLDRLQRELAEKKQKYARAMVYMQRHKSVQEKLMFVFSARNFDQFIRRMRYIREYSTFQRVQGEMLKEKAAEVRRKQNELLNAKTRLETSRVAMQEKHRLLEQSKQSQQRNVQVLNQNLDPYFKLSSRTRYLNVCAVSPGGTYLAVAGLGEENSTYRSVLTILRTDEALPDLDGVDSSAVRMDLGNQIIYDLKFMSQTQICAIGQNSVLLMDVDGNLIKEYDLAQKKLKDYAFSDKGFLALALSQNQAGDKHELLVLDADGIELADEVLQSRVRSISADGKYIGVLTDRAVQIYNRKLELYAQTPELETATKILVRSDGTALLVSSSEAKLYIP